MALKLYVDRLSQPSRALLIFCRANGIEFEEVNIDLANRQHLSPEFREVNPMKQVPVIIHGDFKLFESHAILRYLASAFPEVSDHWYPADIRKRAEIDSILDWHHSNLRRTAFYVFNLVLAPAFGLPKNVEVAAESEKTMIASLAKLDSYWLKEEGGPFLFGNTQPSIADISLLCEIMQLQFIDKETREKILSPYKKVLKWIDETKKATQPHFDEIHETLFAAVEKLQQLQSQ